MNRRTWLIIVFILIVSLILCACGGGGVSNGSGNNGGGGGTTSGPNPNQMGGAIQGNPLNLATTVSTMTGITYGSTDGTGAAALFSYPHGITTDGTNLYIADSDNDTIRKIIISTGVVTTLAGTAGVGGSTDGTGSAARFNSPYGITTDGTNLYIADDANDTIRKIVISTGVVTTLAGTTGVQGS
ncbi:MAG: hypothetical protein ABSB79_10140, partial [Syntrophales bacterium]